MKLKKVMSICLVGALAATLLAGCGSSDTSEAATTEDDTEEVVEEAAETEEAEEAEEVEEAAELEEAEEAEEEEAAEAEEAEEAESSDDMIVGFDQMVTISVKALSLYTGEGADEVIDAANEITESTINVHLDYELMNIDAYVEQLGLMLAGGEAFDLVNFSPIGASTFSTMQSQRQLMDISGYLDEYAPYLSELMADYIGAMEVNGAIYGVPCYRIYASNFYLIMRKDILDELGLTEQAENAASWSDIEEIFAAVYDAQDSLPEDMQTTCVLGNSAGDGSVASASGADLASEDLAGHYGFDMLGDSYGIIRADEDGVVSFWWANDDFKTQIDRVRTWYANDWIYKDAQVTNDNGDTEMRNGMVFAYFDTSEIGVESAKRESTGYDVVCLPVGDNIIQTSNGNTWGWGIPVTSTEPEAAVAYLNLLYQSPELMNLYVYGIEGRDYELNDEGEACVLEDAVYQGSDWLVGNQFICYPAQGQGGDFREVSLESMLEGDISPFYGCTVDVEPIANELTAISSIIDKYGPGLLSGTIENTDETYEAALSEMEDAGIQIVIDWYQSTLDEWLTEQ